MTAARDVGVSPRKPKKPRRLVLGGAAAVGVVAIFFWHQLTSSRPATAPASSGTPEVTVTVVHPEKPGAATLQLSGYTQAYTEAPIYAQTSGYLKKWYFDIGGKVNANDILGEIETPEVDEELAQAKAQLQVAQAAASLAEVTYQRDQTLFIQKVLDGETRDTAADTYAEDQATVVADQANLDRLDALEAFKVLRAPFAGIVTARNKIGRAHV